MSVVGDFRIPAGSFALEHALAAAPGMRIEADRMASHSPEEVMPFLWATGGDFEAFTDALDEDPLVDTVSVADEAGEEVLYRLTWGQAFRDLIHEMIDHHASILEATAREDHWRLRLRFADEGMVSSFQTHFQETGRTFEVRSLRPPEGPRQRKYGLTPEQYEALVTAVRDGYFSIPRAVSVEEVGESLGISANAASQRIRRGCEALVRTSLTNDPE
jgi:hypothetical protein